MSAMSELFTKTNAFVDKLKADAEHLVPEFQDILDDLLGRVGADASTLAGAAEADGEKLATDAETAAEPVVAEAEQDADQLAKTAEADVTTQSAPASAPTTETPTAAVFPLGADGTATGTVSNPLPPGATPAEQIQQLPAGQSATLSAPTSVASPAA